MRVASCVISAVIAAGGVSLFHESATARIRVNNAEIVAGDLVVSGHTRHRYEAIALDDRAARKSDRHRRFVFRIPYYPPNCTITLKTADDERVAAVASCGGQGTQGAPGTIGERGPAGPQGTSGVAGPPGPQGPQGIAGPQGAPGATGPQGIAGPPGLQGIAGPPGAAGATGPVGPQGAAGPAGAQGTAGPAGPPGPSGVSGPQGPQGLPGPPGVAGSPGPKGDPGMQIRQVRQDCAEDRECAVACADDEIALNAFCPKRAPAILTSLREITCGTANQAPMVAICAK